MLETEATERAPAVPVLSVNVSAVVQLSEWTGSVSTIDIIELCLIFY